MKDQLVSIQVLRAVAALAVVFFHFTASLNQDFRLTAGQVFPAGSDGVDIFFVISGFIMAYTTARPEQRSASQFMLKRMSRIVPLYWVLTLLVFAIAVLTPAWLNSTTASPENLIRSLLFIPFAREDGRIEPTLFLGWTLNYEMFFYAVFALAMLAWRRFHIWVAMGTIALFTTLGRFIHTDNVPLKFYSDGIMLEFVWGCLLFLAWQRWPKLLAKLSLVWILGAAALIAQNFIAIPLPREIEKGLPALLIVGGILGGSIKDGVIRRAFARMGDASYSLYLGHPYAIELAAMVMIALLGATVLSAAIAGVLGLALSIAAAFGSYYLLERPSNDWLRRRLAPRKPLAPASSPVSA